MVFFRFVALFRSSVNYTKCSIAQLSLSWFYAGRVKDSVDILQNETEKAMLTLNWIEPNEINQFLKLIAEYKTSNEKFAKTRNREQMCHWVAHFLCELNHKRMIHRNRCWLWRTRQSLIKQFMASYDTHWVYEWVRGGAMPRNNNDNERCIDDKQPFSKNDEKYARPKCNARNFSFFCEAENAGEHLSFGSFFIFYLWNNSLSPRTNKKEQLSRHVSFAGSSIQLLRFVVSARICVLSHCVPKFLFRRSFATRHRMFAMTYAYFSLLLAWHTNDESPERYIDWRGLHFISIPVFPNPILNLILAAKHGTFEIQISGHAALFIRLHLDLLHTAFHTAAPEYWILSAFLIPFN